MYPAEGTCWVIATGVNDAANISAGATAQYDERVEAMMDLLGNDALVLWPIVTTNTDEGNTQRAKRFAAALARAFPASKDSEPSDEKIVGSGL